MSRIIGDDSLRRALNAIAPAPDAKHTESQRAAQQAQLARSTQWMQEQLRHSIAQAIATPSILDCGTTIKVLYGKQGGAVVSSASGAGAIDALWARAGMPAKTSCGSRAGRSAGASS